MSHRDTLTISYAWQSPKSTGPVYDSELEARGAVPNEGRFQTLLKLYVNSNGKIVHTEKVQVS